ncbi:MAG: ATP-binding protein [Ignavibacteria bacterium]|nr:ATP-binding protein [Ignavibacteria bacterium]
MESTITENSFIKYIGILYSGVLQELKKSSNHLQPLYEGITNALESIILLENKKDNGHITIRLFSAGMFENNPKLESIEIEDSGVGFNDENFERMITYKDNRKGFKNKGSGRIQMIHFFDRCDYVSIFKEGKIFKQRSFSLSKSKSYLEKNSIIFYKNTIESDIKEPKTKLVLRDLIDEEDANYYNSLSLLELKQNLISHYMLNFCSHRENLPIINIEHYVNNELKGQEKISSEDIPNFDKKENVVLNYSKISDDGKTVVHTGNKENFEIISFKIDKNKLEKNSIKLTSKHEIVDNVKINLDLISQDDNIEGFRYLFLVSGDYIDKRDSDLRGDLKIPTKEDFFKKRNLFGKEEILLDDIQNEVNSSVSKMYDEINANAEKHENQLNKLRDMFLLNEDTMQDLSFSLNDTEENILGKVYSAEAKSIAKRDAKIKDKIDELDELDDFDTTSENYEQKLSEAVSELVKQIPLQNRATLTHYIARRKLILKLFQKILDRSLKIQAEGNRRMDEKLLHNLIFQQGSLDSSTSDLWLVNEDFIYFKGTSESKLMDIQIDGEKIMKETLTEDEAKYRLSLDEDRFAKRPDILLFPSEGKCIIVEFKDPNVNLAEHINQINRYATLIRNLTKDEFEFDTFYGYLIGETVDGDDVRDFDSSFQYSSHFDYVFRPSKPIVGKFNRKEGSIYMEVLKYSTLLKRAQMRNAIFLDKIDKIDKIELPKS